MTERELAVVLACVALVSGRLALVGYVTQPAMRQASDEERARFRTWVSAGRITFGAALVVDAAIVGSMIRPRIGFIAGLVAAAVLANFLDDRFDLWIR